MSKPRRLWFINRFYYPDHSATSQMLSDLAFHLAARGENVGIITSRGRYDDPSAALPAYEEIRGVAIHRVVETRHGRHGLAGRALDFLRLYLGFASALRRLAQRGDWVIVKTDPPLLSIVIAPVARLKGLTLVNWLQDLYPEVALGLGVKALAPIAPLLIYLRNASLRAAKANVAIGERMHERLLALGVAASAIRTIPNWCDDMAIRPLDAKDNPLRAAWGLNGAFVVGYSGNLGRAHEYDTLLGAAERLRDEPGLIFLFIGGGRQMADVQAQVEARGLSSAFQFRPYQEAALLTQSLGVPDVHWLSLQPAMEGLIVPSKFYGIAAAGRPTLAIADPKGEIAALVTRHGCGLAITPGDHAGLASAIVALKRDPARTAELGVRARLILDQNYSKANAQALWERALN